MSTEENKALVRGYYQATPGEEVTRRIREGEDPRAEAEKYYRASVADYYAPECIIHATDGDLTLEEFIQLMAASLVALPDLKCTIEDMVAEGDRVVTRFTTRFTNERPFQGIPATGKQLAVSEISIKRLANGRVVEDWTIGDQLGLMQQLGVIPKQ